MQTQNSARPFSGITMPDEAAADTRERIDLSPGNNMVYWAGRLQCTHEDLLFAIQQVGNVYTMVDTFLELNRRKNI